MLFKNQKCTNKRNKKRCNLELNFKKRGSKLCPNNYIKTLPISRLNHFFAPLKETDTFKPIQILLFYLAIFKHIVNKLI